MFPLWLFLGVFMIFTGIFNKQLLRLLRIRPMSETFITPNLKHSSKITERILRWVQITLGLSFLVLGLGEALPNYISYKISFLLLGLSGLMILASLAITTANWKAR